jgi:hypothetical protein
MVRKISLIPVIIAGAFWVAGALAADYPKSMPARPRPTTRPGRGRDAIVGRSATHGTTTDANDLVEKP